MKPSEGQAGPVTSLATALFAALPELAQGDFSERRGACRQSAARRRGGGAADRRRAHPRRRSGAARAPFRSAVAAGAGVACRSIGRTVRASGRRRRARGALRRPSRNWSRPAKSGASPRCALIFTSCCSSNPCSRRSRKRAPASISARRVLRSLPKSCARRPRRRGLLFERNAENGALDERLLADAKTADSLPLLQFTLRQLYERRIEARRRDAADARCL